MPKKLILPGSIVLAGILAIVVLVLAKPEPVPAPLAEEPAHLKIAVTKGQLQTSRLAVKTHGTVIPRREIDLVAQVSGQIVKVEPAFVDGGFFSAEEILIHIDDRDYQIALLNAKAKLAQAAQLLAEEEGRSRQAAREWRDLGNQKANDLFIRKPQLAAAKANLESAKGDVKKAELNLERTRLHVPFDGRVKQTYADLGQYVNLGTRIATVYDSTVVEVRIPLTEKQAALVNLPITATTLDTNGGKKPSPVIIRGSIAGKQHVWQGVLARTDAFVDANSRMYHAVVEVANPFSSTNEESTPLLPGLFVEAEIGGKEIDNTMVLPRSALYQQDKILSVDNNNIVQFHNVDVLRKSATQVWVQTSIDNNTTISVEKQSLTPEGTEVKPLFDSSDKPPGSDIGSLAKETP